MRLGGWDGAAGKSSQPGVFSKDAVLDAKVRSDTPVIAPRQQSERCWDYVGHPHILWGLGIVE
jgi:hypothetical protein